MEPRFDIGDTSLATAPSGKPVEALQAEPRSAARIRGIPVYHLTGVTDANRDLVKSTEMWVHYLRRGDEGWYLAVPDAWREAAEAGLGRHGLGLEGADGLPRLDRSFQVAYFVIVGVAFPFMFVANFFLAVIVLIILLNIGRWWWHKSGRSQFQYGEMVKPGAQEKRGSAQSKWDTSTGHWWSDSSICPIAADIPGTPAWIFRHYR